MISTSVLRGLADEPSLPGLTRDALLRTAVRDEAWRSLAAALRLTLREPATVLAEAPANLLFDCGGTDSLPGRPIGHPKNSPDPAIVRAYNTVAALVDFYRICFGRNSVDGAGKTLISSVHFDRGYCNASWTSGQMVYGDGDGYLFRDFTSSNDFIGHELTHGVTEYSANLEYENEPGALNESVSDVFGSMFRQWQALQKVGEADWQIGRDLLARPANDLGWRCIRDLSNPADAQSMTKQPMRYSDYIKGGEPHDNSGIPNYAFFRAATGVGGYSWESVGLVWYKALTSKDVSSNIGFSDFALLTVRAAKILFPNTDLVRDKIEEAWKIVEVI